MRLLKIMCVLGVVMIMGISTQAKAQSIATLQNLDFGEGVITDNAAQRIVTLLSDNSFTNDPEFVFVTNPQRGIYQLTGAPATTPIVVTVTVDQEPLGPGVDFVTDNFDIGAPATTDGAGAATINLGARLVTSGTGTPYLASSVFTGQITIDVTW